MRTIAAVIDLFNHYALNSFAAFPEQPVGYEPSLAFHRKHGFREVGRFRQVARKNNRLFDVVWMQKTL